MSQELALPAETPVMPLRGAVLFPHALLPLHIFEPRYRQMLAHALDDHRMFCVALVKPDAQGEGAGSFFHIATVGLIRACVEREDGTSDMILQGLKRVRFTRFAQSTPFRIARIEPLESDTSASGETEALGTKVLELYRKFKRNGRQLPEKVDQYLSGLHDPEMLADLMAFTFLEDALRRQRVLEQLVVNDRLRLIIQYLLDESP